MRKALCYVALAITLTSLFGVAAQAGYRYRQYYSSWSYYSTSNYHYSRYYYYPTTYATTYSYHYVIYYPTQPRYYYYYYNPTSGNYWGRYDLKEKGYSLLAEKDRKSKLTDIPETAFPKPGAMPAVVGTEDNLKMDVPPAAPTEK